MNLIQPAAVGTLESSDVRITILPNPGEGIEISIDSSVMKLFGESIERTVREVLKDFDVQDAKVELIDKGALDVTIRARMQCAVCRAAQISFDWGKEDSYAG